jgi:transcriptional regulator with XRE-family HTH domain
VAYRKPDPALPKIGARLALTRRALDLTRFQMARLLGTDTSTWGTYEAGLHRIPAEAQALRLRHPARLGLRRQGGQPAPAHPRQNSGAHKT